MGIFDDCFWVPASGAAVASPTDPVKQIALGYYDFDAASGQVVERVWAVNTWNEVFRFNPVPQGGMNGFQRVAGELAQVAVGPQAIPLPTSGFGHRPLSMANIWGVNQAGAVYRRTFDGADNSWELIPGPAGDRMAEVAVGEHSTWGLVRGGGLYEWAGVAHRNQWNFAGNPIVLRSIAVAGETVWGLTYFGRPCRISKGPVFDITYLEGTLVQIAASAAGVCGVNAAGEVHVWTGAQDDIGDHWERVPSSGSLADPHERIPLAFTHVSIGTPGPAYIGDIPRIWAIDVGGSVWQLTRLN